MQDFDEYMRIMISRELKEDVRTDLTTHDGAYLIKVDNGFVFFEQERGSRRYHTKSRSIGGGCWDGIHNPNIDYRPVPSEAIVSYYEAAEMAARYYYAHYKLGYFTLPEDAQQADSEGTS